MGQNAAQDRLIWIDLEMTGLDTDRDSILEIATVVTDANLEVLAEGPSLAIAHPLATLEAMDEWNRNQHGKSGLWRRVLEEGVSMAEAEARTIAFLREWVEAGQSPMCGNSICQDRRFLHRLMPRLEQYFHYRNLDVSTIKELARRWAPQVLAGVQKQARTPPWPTSTTPSPSYATTAGTWRRWRCRADPPRSSIAGRAGRSARRPMRRRSRGRARRRGGRGPGSTWSTRP